MIRPCNYWNMDAILDCVDEIALDGLDGKYFSLTS